MTESATKCPSYAERFADYYRRRNMRCEILDGTLWVEQNRIIFPDGPTARSYAISAETAQSLLSHSRTALLLRCAGGYGPEVTSRKWYSVICRSFIPLERCSANMRKQMRKGLRCCVAKKVDADYIARNAYEVHLAAFKRYGIRPKTKEQFVQDVLAARDFSDVIDFWAVFYQGRMVGFAHSHVYAGLEVQHCGMSFDPDYFRFYCSNALIYTMNEYYLQEKSFPFVNNGFRAVLHQTNIYEYLIQHFGYEYAYMNLYVHYKPLLGRVMSLPALAHNVLAKFSGKFAALNRLHEAGTIVPHI